MEYIFVANEYTPARNAITATCYYSSMENAIHSITEYLRTMYSEEEINDWIAAGERDPDGEYFIFSVPETIDYCASDYEIFKEKLDCDFQ